MIPVPEDSADWGDTLQDLEFLTLTDSTFQYMLTGDQSDLPRSGPHSELQALREHHALHPGATFVAMPPHLRTLSRRSSYSNPAVIGMLKDNLHKKVNVALIPIEDSIPEDRQVHYDWIGGARAAYDQRIMTLGPLSHQAIWQQG